MLEIRILFLQSIDFGLHTDLLGFDGQIVNTIFSNKLLREVKVIFGDVGTLVEAFLIFALFSRFPFDFMEKLHASHFKISELW